MAFEAIAGDPSVWGHVDQRVALEMLRDGVEHGTVDREKLAGLLDKLAARTTNQYTLAVWRAIRIDLPGATVKTKIEFFQDLISNDLMQYVEAMALSSGKLLTGDELFFGAVIGLLASGQLNADVRFRIQGLLADYKGERNGS